jgi:hypothetical protein
MELVRCYDIYFYCRYEYSSMERSNVLEKVRRGRSKQSLSDAKNKMELRSSLCAK